MSCLFESCRPLISLPDISTWNTNNITDISGLFHNCLIEKIHDISKWNTNSVTDISYLFAFCSSLLSVSDILK